MTKTIPLHLTEPTVSILENTLNNPSLKEQVDKLQRYWFDHDWYDKNEKWDWLRYDDLLDLLNEPK